MRQLRRPTRFRSLARVSIFLGERDQPLFVLYFSKSVVSGRFFPHSFHKTNYAKLSGGLVPAQPVGTSFGHPPRAALIRTGPPMPRTRIPTFANARAEQIMRSHPPPSTRTQHQPKITDPRWLRRSWESQMRSTSTTQHLKKQKTPTIASSAGPTHSSSPLVRRELH
jgi:hypothetical protein